MFRKIFYMILIIIMTLGTASCNDQTTTNSNNETHTHSYDSASCVEPAHCACGATKGQALGHDFSEATCTTPKICKRCNIVASAALDHDFKAATCTSPQICKRCENVVGNPLGHSYMEATCLAPKTCSICKSAKDSPLGHSYVNNICIRCEQVDPASLPMPLENLFIISEFAHSISPITSSYGDAYANAHLYGKGEVSATSVHNLNREYSIFTGSIVAPTELQTTVSVFVYVDDVIVYSINNINIETPKIDFQINVKNATKLKIEVQKDNYVWRGPGIAIVNAQLKR